MFVLLKSKRVLRFRFVYMCHRHAEQYYNNQIRATTTDLNQTKSWQIPNVRSVLRLMCVCARMVNEPPRKSLCCSAHIRAWVGGRANGELALQLHKPRKNTKPRHYNIIWPPYKFNFFHHLNNSSRAIFSHCAST